MLHRSILVIHLALLFIAAFFSFLTVRSYEEMTTTVPAGVVWASSNDQTANHSQITETVEGFARETGVSVALQVPDLRDPGSVRHLYLAPGREGALASDWLEDGYPVFGHTMDTRVHPFGELDRDDPRGFYLVFGTEADTDAFEATLAGIGLHDTNSEGGYALRWTDLFRLGGDLSFALIITVLCGITVTGSGVLLNARNYGVLRLQGYSYTRILARDLVQIGRFYLLAGGCTAVGITAALLLYNGLAQFALFARIAGWLLALFLGTALLTHAFALALLQATSLLDALKGRIPARPATASAYAVRVPALVLVLVSVSLVVHSAQNLREHRKEFDTYSEAGQASRITLSGSVDFAEVGESMDPLVGGWLRQADEEGQIILSVRQQSAILAPPGEPGPGADLLVVNDTYLEHQEILSPDGERYGPSDTVRVLLPQSLAEWGETVAQSAGEQAASWNSFGRPAGGDPQRFDTEVLPTADGQEVFTYGSDGPVGRPRVPFLDDPMIFVLPDGAVLSDQLYVTFATQAGIVFPDPEEVEESIATPPFSTYINGLQMVVTSLADDYAEQVRHLRLQSFNLAAATGVLVMTAVAVCLVHVRTRAQTIFAKHISGWRFTAIHRRLLVAEGALALAFLGWAALRAFRVLIRVDGPTAPGTLAPTPEQAAVAALEPLLAIAIAGGGLLLIAAILLHFHRRIVREGAAQA